MSVYTLFSCGFLLYEFVDTFSFRKNVDTEVRLYTNNSSFLLETLNPNIKSIKIRLIIIRIVCTILFFIFIGLLIFLGVILFRNLNNMTSDSYPSVSGASLSENPPETGDYQQ